MFTRARLTRWTDALRANPEEQGRSKLICENGKSCCLGKLCKVEGLKIINNEYVVFPSIENPDCIVTDNGLLTGDLAEEFGDKIGTFNSIGMPDLFYKEIHYEIAANANDLGVPWTVIADHFDKYYPCSDEQHQELAVNKKAGK